MKKLMMIGSALLVLSSTSAYATQARLLALGMKETDNDGMYYIQDSRNIFLNVAYVNDYADQIVTEYGAIGASIAGSARTTLDKSNTPKAQGGVFKKFGSMVYGVYLGNESNTSSLLRIAGSNSAARLLQTADNQVDLFVAGDAGLKWGANLLYGAGKDETATIESKDSALATRFGLIGSNWDAHANISLGSKSERKDAASADSEFKGKVGVHVGGSYNIADGKVFGYVKTYGWDQKLASATMVKGDFTSYYLGYGQDMTVNGSDKIFASLGARKTDVNIKFSTKAEVRHLVIPLTLGYEAKATEWLTLRGSVIQNLYGKRDNKFVTDNAGLNGLNAAAAGVVTNVYGATGKSTIANSTEVNAGASLNFGQLTIDGLIGLTDSTGAVDDPGTTVGKKGVLSASNLETKVAATFKF